MIITILQLWLQTSCYHYPVFYSFSRINMCCTIICVIASAQKNLNTYYCTSKNPDSTEHAGRSKQANLSDVDTDRSRGITWAQCNHHISMTRRVLLYRAFTRFKCLKQAINFGNFDQTNTAGWTKISVLLISGEHSVIQLGFQLKLQNLCMKMRL